MLTFFSNHTFLIGQLFGVLAMITGILMYQFKKHKTIMLLMLLCSTFWCIHFAFLKAATGVVMNVINVARAMVFTQRDKPWCEKKWVPAAFSVASVIAVIFTWEGIYSLLPCVASIAATIGSWQKDTQKLRLYTIVVCIGWFTYNAIKGSWAGMANELFIFFSVLTALWRFHFYGTEEPAPAQPAEEEAPEQAASSSEACPADETPEASPADTPADETNPESV